ncbi:MAG: S8 family peptidase [Acidimicrobiia bacterium]
MQASSDPAARQAAFAELGAIEARDLGRGWWSLRLRRADRVDALRARAARARGVQALESNDVYRPAAVTPALTDPRTSEQWALEQTNDVDLDILRAWKVTQGTPSTVVAVIDTGIALNHEDLKVNLWTNTKEIAGNGIDDDRNGVVDDVNGAQFSGGGTPSGSPLETADSGTFVGHGTHLAGVIAAKAGNGLGIAGVAPGARIMPVKIYDGNGSTTIADIVAAIHYAVANGAKVINASFAGASCNEALYSAFRDADIADVLSVIAAGNDGSTSKVFPAAFPLRSSISVGAIDSDGAVAIYSNHGSWVNVFAPGTNILSTYPDSTYAYWSGTSMAAPQVAGVVALVRSLHPTWTALQVKQKVLASVDVDARYSGNASTGGRVNAGNAVDAPAA